MPSQRITVMRISGARGMAIADRLRTVAADSALQLESPELAVREAEAIIDDVLDHASNPAVTYFHVWLDRWLFDVDVAGQLASFGVSGSTAASGWCCIEWPSRHLEEYLAAGIHQFPEESCLQRALRDASDAYDRVVPTGAILVLREVFGPSVQDDEVVEAASRADAWSAYPYPCPGRD